MAVETTTNTSAADLAKLAVRVLGRIVKPGGWNYLMPEPLKEEPTDDKKDEE